MIALYASQSAGATATTTANVLRSFSPECLVLRTTATAAANITGVRNHPSYRVKHAPIRQRPHFINEEEVEASSSRSPRAVCCANSKKYTIAQINRARYKASVIAVVCR